VFITNHKAVVFGVGCQRHPQPHLVFSLGDISQRNPSLRNKKRQSQRNNYVYSNTDVSTDFEDFFAYIFSLLLCTCGQVASQAFANPMTTHGS
jgi:hypothetical protein